MECPMFDGKESQVFQSVWRISASTHPAAEWDVLNGSQSIEIFEKDEFKESSEKC